MIGKTTGCVLDVARQRGDAMPSVVTLTDHSRFGNDGAMTNVTWVQLPSGLWVMNFDGSGYVERTVANWRSTDSSGTVCAWFKLPPGYTSFAIILSSSDEATNNYACQVVTYNSYFGVWQKNNDVIDANYSTNGFNDGNWHFGCVVSHGIAYSIFVDGAEETIQILSGLNNGDWFADTDRRDNFTVGIRHYGGGYVAGFNGNIVLVRVYCYALTPAEIRARYSATRRLFGV